MKNARKGALLPIMALGLSLALAGSVWAQNTKTRGGAISLTPEQAAEMFDLKEKFNAETVDLRRELVIKRAELDALKAAEKPDQDAIQAKQKELSALMEQAQEKTAAFRAEVKKIVPDYQMSRDQDEGKLIGHRQGAGTVPEVEPPPPPAKQ